MRLKSFVVMAAALLLASLEGRAQQWTLEQCIAHALEHNIQIQQARVEQERGDVSLWQARGQLFPNLSFSTSHTLGYRPFEESTQMVHDGQVTTSSNKTTYSGSYGLSANVTLWNGGINYQNIKAQKLQNRISELSTEQSEQSIQEQIATLYVQILYSREAVEVNRQMEQTARSQYERAQVMQEQGQMSRADVKQMEAQWRSAQYDIVSGETALADYKRQLKSLLQLPVDQDFDVSARVPGDDEVTAPLPTKEETLEAALQCRPEIRSAELGVDAADLQLDIARRGFLPSISVGASLGDNHFSASTNPYGEQLKRNLNLSAGVTLSVPIFDNRQNRAAVRRARLGQLDSRLSLEDSRVTLGSTIERLWLDANSNQQRYVSARAQTESREESYNLLNEQFAEGLKNVVEVQEGRDQLLQAKQAELQSKYSALLNRQLLAFYTGQPIAL